MTARLKKIRLSLARPRTGTFAAGLLIDTLVMLAAYLAAFFLRFDFSEPRWGWPAVFRASLSVILIQWAALFACGCPRRAWRYFSVCDIPRFIAAIAATMTLQLILRLLFATEGWLWLRPPVTITLLNGLLTLTGLLGVRIFWRWAAEAAEPALPGGVRRKNVLIFGAGTIGNRVVRELLRGDTTLNAIGFLDDNPAKTGTLILGLPVLGRFADAPRIIPRYGVTELIVAIAHPPRSVMQAIIETARGAGLTVRMAPLLEDWMSGSQAPLREPDVADLLGRRETATDFTRVVAMLSGRRVMVTGAGGSIGSEIVRQALQCGPEMLIMVEMCENALYEIERRIRALGSETPVVPILADIGDKARMSAVFQRWRPEIILHAAAYKHVPMIEINPIEAIRNNVLATRTLGELALAHSVSRFVLISTDKAVRPLSIMGLSKRLAEIVLRDLNGRGPTCFSIVRFGNVLDSSGSVVPLFREQIRKGGPVTVTHPDMRRYFMTISEAVSLVLQSATIASRGEIFVLDMGDPVSILDLAETMITLSGLRPRVDIPIRFVGIRPGEKLFEELDVSEKSAVKTGLARIFISKAPTYPEVRVKEILTVCRLLIGEPLVTPEHIRERLQALIGENQEPAHEHNH